MTLANDGTPAEQIILASVPDPNAQDSFLVLFLDRKIRRMSSPEMEKQIERLKAARMTNQPSGSREL